MAKYEVTMTWEGWWSVEVEASSEEEARRIGEEMIVGGEGQEVGGEWVESAEAGLLEEDEDEDEDE